MSNYFVTHDAGLLAHWRAALGHRPNDAIPTIDALLAMQWKSNAVLWIDTALPRLPIWTRQSWLPVLGQDQVRMVACSSHPNDIEGMSVLDAGCVGYCHAFSDATTLLQVQQVVRTGQVWIGKSLMQRLLGSVRQVAMQAVASDIAWIEGLTQREMEVAILAANGASNSAIAGQCNISERTVKAHLSAVFMKLNITDRLQLALRVHGIR